MCVGGSVGELEDKLEEISQELGQKDIRKIEKNGRTNQKLKNKKWSQRNSRENREKWRGGKWQRNNTGKFPSLKHRSF